MKNPQFDLEQFSKVNLERCDSPLGFNMGHKDLTYFAAGIGEEAGEVIGCIKKLERGFNKREFKKTKERFIKDCKRRHDKLVEDGKTAPVDDEQWEKNAAVISDEEWETLWRHHQTKKLADELADLFTFMNLVTSKVGGIDLFWAVKEKFNKVSKEMECEQFNIG